MKPSHKQIDFYPKQQDPFVQRGDRPITPLSREGVPTCDPRSTKNLQYEGALGAKDMAYEEAAQELNSQRRSRPSDRPSSGLDMARCESQTALGGTSAD